MAQYRKKPVVVEATQWNAPGDHPAVVTVPSFGGTRFDAPHVLGKQGLVLVNAGDWIITESDGSGHYPCAPDIFTATYEPVV